MMTQGKSTGGAIYVVFLLIVLLFSLGGCAQGSLIAEPPDIRFGEDMCASCGMVISDPRFASAAAFEIEPGRYENLAFDDIGDMVHHIRDNPEMKFTNFWAKDYRSEAWIDATSGWFVVSPQIQSPMMHGVAAFAEQENAEALAAELGGELLRWDQMRATVLMHDH